MSMIGEEKARDQIVRAMLQSTGPGWKIKSIARYDLIRQPCWIAIAEGEDGELQEGVFRVDSYGVLIHDQPIYRVDQYGVSGTGNASHI